VRAFVLGAVTLLAGDAVVMTSGGCGPSCSTSERVVTTGTVTEGVAESVFETSPPEGPFLPFNGQTFLHVQHGLKTKHVRVTPYLSFSEYPLTPGNGGYSLAAGNQAVIEKQDENEVLIKNDSCANYWIRVVVTATNVGPDADAGTSG
jgi:hypothetical protein